MSVFSRCFLSLLLLSGLSAAAIEKANFSPDEAFDRHENIQYFAKDLLGYSQHYFSRDTRFSSSRFESELTRHFGSLSWAESFRQIEKQYGWDAMKGLRETLRTKLLKEQFLETLYYSFADATCHVLLPKAEHRSTMVNHIIDTAGLMDPEFNKEAISLVQENISLKEVRNEVFLNRIGKKMNEVEQAKYDHLNEKINQNLYALEKLKILETYRNRGYQFRNSDETMKKIHGDSIERAIMWRLRRRAEGGDMYLLRWQKLLLDFAAKMQLGC